MSRIIFVPQYPTPMRYQEWWWWKLREEFENAGFDVLTLGADTVRILEGTRDSAMFSPINAAIELECAQINAYMNLKFREDDVLFLADISFPGFFTNVLFHKRPPDRAFAFCHATSLNILDYFEYVRLSKFAVESAHDLMFDAVFVGSDYHDDKLGWPNTIVTRLPYPPLETFKMEKTLDIVSASRPNPQKVDSILELKVEKRFGKAIMRNGSNDWKSYYRFLSKSKVLLITSKEETFGYQIVDAVLNGCIPVAPNRCSYPELLPAQYLYENEEDLFVLLDTALSGGLRVPDLLCHGEMEDFYKNIIEIISGVPSAI